MNISERVAQVQQNIQEAALACGRKPEDITLVAATKTQAHEHIVQAISSGIKVCGENRVQEMVLHQQENSYIGAKLHFIGHLQRNKVKQVVGQVDLIQSVGSFSLLEEISKQATKLELIQNILLEVNICQESSKSGFLVEDFEKIYDFVPEMSGINVKGIMAIPEKVDDLSSQTKIFERLYKLYIDFLEKMSDNYKEINCLSMGMSEDYQLAIAQGSTMVRVGTALFGAR